MIDSLSIAVHAFVSRVSMSFSVDETLLPGRAKAGRPARTYIQQLCEDTGCSPEDLPEAMNDREKWRERFRVYPCQRHDMIRMMMMVINNT